MDNTDLLFAGMVVTCLTVGGIVVGGIVVWSIGDTVQHEVDFGLGSSVTTTAEYEILTNDSFTGVVARGEGWRDPALTVRNRDGEERRIATQWLTPV